MDKKGTVGLGTGKKVMLALMVLGLLAFATIVVLQAINDTTVASTTGSGYVVNETVANVGSVGVDTTVSGMPDAICSVVIATEAENSTVIGSPNYTMTGCNLAFVGNISGYNNTDWDVTYTYTFNRISGINNNITNATEDFFSNAGTWFALLAIVVIILIVVIVMKSVNSIGGDKGGL